MLIKIRSNQLLLYEHLMKSIKNEGCKKKLAKTVPFPACANRLHWKQKRKQELYPQQIKWFGFNENVQFVKLAFVQRQQQRQRTTIQMTYSHNSRAKNSSLIILNRERHWNIWHKLQRPTFFSLLIIGEGKIRRTKSGKSRKSSTDIEREHFHCDRSQLHDTKLSEKKLAPFFVVFQFPSAAYSRARNTVSCVRKYICIYKKEIDSKLRSLTTGAIRSLCISQNQA